jgi:type IV pilus assembly protein PilA
MAIASLVLGIVSVLGGVLLIVPGVLAIVFGHIARSHGRKNNLQAGMGISLAGLIMGYVSIAVVPMFGLMAAMAIPAFQKVREASLDKAMHNNARLLQAASEQYYLEHNVSVVNLADLVGPGADRYIKSLTPVAGETYPVKLVKGQPIVVQKINGNVITLDPEGSTRR